MDKVYLLLRNNRQTGPYLLPELVQQQLLPNDLIWIEGKSMGWLYPAEYAELKPYIMPAKDIAVPKSSDDISQPITPLPAAQSSRHIYVSLPAHPIANSHTTTTENSLEQQAEALRKKAEAYAAAHRSINNDTDQPPAYIPKNINDLQKDYTTWLHQQTKKKKHRFYKRIGVTAFILLLLSGGGYILAKDGLLKETAALPANHILKSEAAQSAKSNSKSKQYITAPEVTAQDSMASVLNVPVALSVGKKSKPNKQLNITVKIAVPIVTDIEKDKEGDRPPLTDNTKITVNQAEATEPAIATTNNNTFGKKISRLFKKHKRNNAGENSISDLATKADVTFTSAHNAAGTQSLKLTLHNHSGDTIKTAVVEVRYYGKQNDIIEKRLVTFKNVLPNDAAMQTVTGNRLTDHIYYQLLSADN